MGKSNNLNPGIDQENKTPEDFSKSKKSRKNESGKSNQKRGRNRGRKPTNKPNPGKPENIRPEKEREPVPTRNDWSWYAASEIIARDIASIPFNVITGSRYTLRGRTGANVDSYYIPTESIGVVNYVPAPGVAEKRTDGLNMAAVQLYSFVRHANSGARNYEAADMMMYVLAMQDIYTTAFMIKRILGISQCYTYFNHFTPEGILLALGYSPDDIRANHANYRARLNILIDKINSFAVPSYFKAFDRGAFINSKVFADSTSIRGQFYVFKKMGYYTWSGTTSEQGTELVFDLFQEDGTYKDLDYLLSVLDDQLSSLYLDEDALTMSGDILKAFNESELYNITPITADYVVVPEYDENILAQIENMVTLQTAAGYGLQNDRLTQWNVTQDNQLIKWKPILTSAGQLTTRSMVDYVFNSHKDAPEYIDVLEWSRLMVTADVILNDGTPQSNTVTLSSCGCEVPLAFTMVRYSAENPSSLDSESLALQLQDVDSINSSGTQYRIQQYDWHPFIYVYDTSVSAGLALTQVAGDAKIITVMPKEVIQRINESANYSVYYAENLYAKAKAR